MARKENGFNLNKIQFDIAVKPKEVAIDWGLDKIDMAGGKVIMMTRGETVLSLFIKDSVVNKSGDVKAAFGVVAALIEKEDLLKAAKAEVPAVDEGGDVSEEMDVDTSLIEEVNWERAAKAGIVAIEKGTGKVVSMILSGGLLAEFGFDLLEEGWLYPVIDEELLKPGSELLAAVNNLIETRAPQSPVVIKV